MHDAETGLYYYNSRYYDPVIGRFVMADSIIPSTGVPQSFNPYSYCHNDPVNFHDPSGHSRRAARATSFAHSMAYAAEVQALQNMGTIITLTTVALQATGFGTGWTIPIMGALATACNAAASSLQNVSWMDIGINVAAGLAGGYAGFAAASYMPIMVSLGITGVVNAVGFGSQFVPGVSSRVARPAMIFTLAFDGRYIAGLVRANSNTLANNKREIESLQEQVGRLTAQIGTATEERAQLSAQLDIANADNARLRQENNSLQTENIARGYTGTRTSSPSSGGGIGGDLIDLFSI
jgi:RHS repeat-associated protein